MFSIDELINEAENFDEDCYHLQDPAPETNQNCVNLKDHASTSGLDLLDSSDLNSVGVRPSKGESNDRDLDLTPGSRWLPTVSAVATRFDGTKVRIPRRKMVGEISSRTTRLSSEEFKKQCSNLLDEPIHRMIAKVTHQNSIKKTEPGVSEKGSSCVDAQESKTLWTDRYRPKKFIDLIGDERVFRNAMGWLKGWDKCVFNRQDLNKRKRFQSTFNNSSKFSNQSTSEAEIDDYGRPNEKVLLLTGKPGLGKTTMAKVIADQAGYQTIEINASDDRNSKTVSERIRSALESRTLDGGAKAGGGLSLKSNRPCCVIIDEIDGAGGGGGGGGASNESGFVNALVKLVTEGSTSKKNSIDQGKKLDQRPLLRPIICICNDLYAPVLRPLRPISRIIRFTSPSPASLIRRLESICRFENLIADKTNLSYLVRLAAGDLRSCLNTLQFLKTQSNCLSDQLIRSAADVGIKDLSSSVQAILSSIFKVPSKTKFNKANDSDKNGGGDFNKLATDISTCGLYDRIVQGCFEFYPSMKPPTDQWNTYERMYDYLNFYDQLENKIWTNQAYELLGYVPYSIISWRLLFGSQSNRTTDLYPKSDYENYQKRLSNEEVMNSFNRTVPIGIKNCFKAREINCEFLPMAVRIICADRLRPVNSQIIRKEEREVLSWVIGLMLELGVRFVVDRGEDGQLRFVMEPQIEYSVLYDGKKPADIAISRFSVRQLIAREVNFFMDLELQRRNRGSVNGEKGKNLSNATSIIEAYKKKPLMEKKDLVEKNENAIDFFGRSVVLKGHEDNRMKTKNEKIKVLFKFHEGFSNAVKKPIRLNEFLLK
ncbi:P-loop containing nucleoside triphosphate hydrolase protein [Phakopsora pachyrhizi]|uniref:P-loop containing nucleoside triphosphate hydrolase protein n=1 Tax=Phakopsora pachyrhizi TaxID=170000 RepID=A0AAV0ASC5_PHAPC|nr:P-loop containing nucleoside triphosphate hydrolase protein [Phakopsora pachyrhizi]CAH7672155.1 P-loop containing nucleoside triphosphate hydrolase protein [Phakopsora pachyrhizi]